MGVNLGPFKMLLTRATPPALRRISLLCTFEPDAVVSARNNMIAHLTALSERLTRQRGRWAACLPPNSPAVRLNFPLMYFLSIHFAYEDKDFAHDLAVGMPIAGEVPAAGALRPRIRGASITIEQWRGGTPARNRAILERILATKGDPLAEV